MMEVGSGVGSAVMLTNVSCVVSAFSVVIQPTDPAGRPSRARYASGISPNEPPKLNT